MKSVSTSGSETAQTPPTGASRRLRVAVTLVLVALGTAALGFYLTQNGSGRIGGEIAAPKMLWLLYAVTLWLVLPFAIALDARTPRLVWRTCIVLFSVMALRGLIELWMLYVSLNWSPWYGIAHDALCMGLLGTGIVQAVRADEHRKPLGGLLAIHLVVTALAFVPEIYFAHYMATHFRTVGEAAIYVVPDDPRYRGVLQVTTLVVAALSIYLPAFLWGWLFGPTRCMHSPHR